MPGFFKVEVSIGTIHDSRFTFLSEKTLLHLGDFDGDFTELMSHLAIGAGPVFDAIFCQVENPPPSPVAANVDMFLESAGVHLAHPLNLYTACPGATAKEIKSLAAAAGVTGGGEQRPFLVVLPIKSKIAFVEVQLLLRAATERPRTWTRSARRLRHAANTFRTSLTSRRASLRRFFNRMACSCHF